MYAILSNLKYSMYFDPSPCQIRRPESELAWWDLSRVCAHLIRELIHKLNENSNFFTSLPLAWTVLKT